MSRPSPHLPSTQGAQPPPAAALSATIVICARNAATHLARSIPAALAQQYPRPFQVLVVDNGSTDDTARVAARLGARVVSCRRPGVVHARQRGWRACRTALVAFLDADCEPPPDWLAGLAAPFLADPTMGAAGARLIPGSVRTLAERHIVEARILDTDRFWTRNALQWPFLATAATVYRRRALAAVGGFDITLGRITGEDADLCWRLERAGWLVTYHPGIAVVHHHRATVRAMLRQARWYGLGSAAVFARWRHELGWRRYTDWAPYRRLAAGLLRAPAALVRGADAYERCRPCLEALDAAAFLVGKWQGAAHHRMWFL